MKSATLRLVVFVALLLVTVQFWAAPPETMTRIDVPGAVFTSPSGINPDGTIVGWYCLSLPCNAPHTRGFMLKDGVFTYIDVPSTLDRPSIGTQPRYISPQGVVIGAYFSEMFKQEDGNLVPRFRGFAWYQGMFTYFDAPDGLYDNPEWPHSIIPRAINSKGQVVGCIHDKNQTNSMYGFVLSDGTFTKLDMSMTMNNGIAETGDIVGLDNSSPNSYRIDKFGNQTPITYPGADFTSAWDMNLRGDIVGQAGTNGGTVGHAFLLTSNGVARFLDPPGALSAVAFSINANGDVVGQYRDANGPQCTKTACVHGFALHRGD